LSGDLCKEFVETYNVPIKQAYGIYLELIHFFFYTQNLIFSSFLLGLTEATPFATATKTHEIVDGRLRDNIFLLFAIFKYLPQFSS
jgi:hypothetical protein